MSVSSASARPINPYRRSRDLVSDNGYDPLREHRIEAPGLTAADLDHLTRVHFAQGKREGLNEERARGEELAERAFDDGVESMRRPMILEVTNRAGVEVANRIGPIGMKLLELADTDRRQLPRADLEDVLRVLATQAREAMGAVESVRSQMLDELPPETDGQTRGVGYRGFPR